MKQEDIDFLKELQHELNTQDHQSQASPRYWGIMERKTVATPDGCGDDVRFYFDECDGDFSMDELIEYVENYYVEEMDSEVREEWEDLLESEPSPWEMKHFLEDNDIIDEVRYVDVEEQDVLSEQTGCFLTRRAAQEYIDRFGYNHSQPRTYAMTAYRNFELERLLDILQTMDIDEIDQLFKSKRDDFYRRVEIGSVLTGEVKSINKKGAVIDFKYTEAFLPAAEMSWNPDDEPGDVMKRGDTINVVVLDYDDDTREMKLGYKQLIFRD